MPRIIPLILICAFVLSVSIPAQACWRAGDLEHINKEMDVTFPNADVVFIGTLIEDKQNDPNDPFDSEYIFRIEKGIKNAEDGKSYTARLGPNMTYCSYVPVSGLFLYVHRPAKDAPPAPAPSEEYIKELSSLNQNWTSDEIKGFWENKWKLSFAAMGSPTLIRVGGRYYPSDAAFIKEKFGYDITVGATEPQKEKSE